MSECGVRAPDWPEGETCYFTGTRHFLHRTRSDLIWVDRDEESRLRATVPSTTKPRRGAPKRLDGLIGIMQGAPVLPYGGENQPENSGHSGTDTSQERAEYLDASGLTKDRQITAVRLLIEHGETGMTVAELRRWYRSQGVSEDEMHHGSASGVLSVLNKTRYIALLRERRDGCHVYVMPQFIAGRDLHQKRKSLSTA